MPIVLDPITYIPSPGVPGSEAAQVVITLLEPTVDQLMAESWTGLHLERGVSSTNLASFALVAEIPYVAGQTVYTYIDATGAPSDWYRTVRYALPGPSYGTYSPPWPVKHVPTAVGDGSRRSLKYCRRMLARRLGSLQLIATTADGNDSGTAFIARALANQMDPNRYRGWWVMPSDGVSSGEVRTLAENAVNVSSGLVAVQPPFLSRIVQGTQIELHKLLPPDEQTGPLIGLRQCLNMALAECWVLDRLVVTGSGASTINISALGDWLDPVATNELYAPQQAGLPAAPFGPYVVRSDAEVTALDVTGLAAGAVASLELTRPADTYIKTNGVWADQQAGFTWDDDECLLQPSFLVEVALVYAYEALMGAAVGAPQVRYTALGEKQRRLVNNMKRMPGALPRPRERVRGTGVGDEWSNGGAWDAKSWFN